MKFNGKEFKDAIGKSVADKKACMPILKYVSFTPNNGKYVTIKSTNLSLSVASYVSCEDNQTFSGLLHCEDLTRLCKSIKPKSTVEILHSDNDMASIEIDGLKTIIPCIKDQSDFPSFPTVPSTSYNLEKDFLERLPFISYSVCNPNQVRPHISQIKMHKRDMISTDGHRLHMTKLSHKDSLDLCIPGFMVPWLLKFKDTPLSIAQSLNRKSDDKKCPGYKDFYELIKINILNHTIISTTDQVDFPPYDQVIPKNFDTQITVTDTAKTLKALEFHAAQNMAVKLNMIGTYATFIFNDGTEFDFGTTDHHIEKPWLGAYNINYLIDALKSLSTKSIKLEVNAPLDPLVMVIGDNKALVMPMRV